MVPGPHQTEKSGPFSNRAVHIKGEIVSDFTGAVTLTAYSDTCVTEVSGALLYGTQNAVAGVAAFTIAKVIDTRVTHLRATVYGGISLCSDAFPVSAGSIASIAFTTQPSNVAVADAALAQQPVLALRDSGRAVVTNSNSGVTLTGYSDNCVTAVSNGLSGNTVSAVAGVATFTSAKILSASVTRIGASDGIHTVCSSTIVVSTGAVSLAQSTLTTSSATLVAGTTATLTIVLRDSAGNQIPDAAQASNLSIEVPGTGDKGFLNDAPTVLGLIFEFWSAFAVEGMRTIPPKIILAIFLAWVKTSSEPFAQCLSTGTELYDF